MLHVPADCSCCLSMLHVRPAYPHACPYCMFVLAACPRLNYMYMLHVHASYPRCNSMLNVHTACPYLCCLPMLMLHIHASCPWFLSMLHVHASSLCFMFMLYSMSVLCVRAVCLRPCCMLCPYCMSFKWNPRCPFCLCMLHIHAVCAF